MSDDTKGFGLDPEHHQHPTLMRVARREPSISTTTCPSISIVMA
jgi:hypothetical protein